MPAQEVITPLVAAVSIGWIVLLIGAVTLLLFAAWRLPDIAEAATAGDRKALGEVLSETGSALVVCVAQGFGVGRAPFAPGTFGSALGVGWFVLLVAGGEYWAYLGGTLFGLAVSVIFCGLAERIMKEKDPSSVVLDEIAAMPVCFLPWVTITHVKLQGMPPVEQFFTARAWLLTLLVFALFRGFDVLKPWPIRQSQRLPGGWGVTMDDVLAAVAAGLISLWLVR